MDETTEPDSETLGQPTQSPPSIPPLASGGVEAFSGAVTSNPLEPTLPPAGKPNPEQPAASEK